MAIKKSEIYSDLWKSCDELRGGMDASQYKDYILSILFIKYISDKYAGKKDSQVTIPIPRAPRLDEERFHIDPAEPLTDRLGGELRAVVGADVISWAAVCEQVREKVQHIVCADPTGDQDGETFPGVLVDDRQHPEGPTIMCPGQDEGVGSDVVRPARSETDAGPVVEPQPPPLRLLLGNFQPLAPPDAFDPLVVDDPTLGPEHRRDAAIAVAAILTGQPDDRRRQRRLVVRNTMRTPLRRTRLSQKARLATSA